MTKLGNNKTHSKKNWGKKQIQKQQSPRILCHLFGTPEENEKQNSLATETKHDREIEFATLQSEFQPPT